MGHQNIKGFTVKLKVKGVSMRGAISSIISGGLDEHDEQIRAD